MLPLVLLVLCVSATAYGDDQPDYLYPQDSESRERRSLDGVWQFRAAPAEDPDQGFREHWYREPLERSGATIDMPVPSSFNDITQSSVLRDHVGWVWYSRQAFVPRSWTSARVMLRFGSVHYTAKVYINGEPVLEHSGGHVPFSADVSRFLLYGRSNLLTVAVNNTLSDVTVPQGRVVHSASNKNYVYPANDSVLYYEFDFFNYAGIHRPVVLYKTPVALYVRDITITSQLLFNGSAIVDYSVETSSGDSFGQAFIQIELMDPNDKKVLQSQGAKGRMLVTLPQLWWPFLMNQSPGKQYTLVVKCRLNSSNGDDVDVYRQKFGIRHLSWNSTGVFINSRKLYIRGLGKHEDSDIRGKGLDLPLVVKDFNLLAWLGVNCFRTSHYPYADEIMDMADSRGILVIDETPAVSLDYSATKTDSRLLNQHLRVLEELVHRDKNRPSVLMWSLSNEAKTGQVQAVHYYKHLLQRLHQLDVTRPVTAVLNTYPHTERVADMLDVILVNRYFGWYSDTGRVQLVRRQAEHFFTRWHETFNKSVVNSEYGADTVAGLHRQPSYIFSEEYQVQLMAENFAAFESMRAAGWFMGEMIWNFADFMTKQQVNRVGGNKKGVFTRQRQPKMAAHLLRSRYWQLAVDIDDHNITLPTDLMFSDVFTGLELQCRNNN